MADTVSELSVQADERKLVTVRSNGAPLCGVLWAISAQTGITLNITGEVPSDGAPVVEDFADRSLKNSFVYLLETYLKRPSYTLVTNRDTGQLVSVHVFPGADGVSHSPRSNRPGLYDSDDEAQPGDDRDVVEETGALPDSLVRTIAETSVASNHQEWLDALQTLENYEDPRTLDVLQSALLSEQPEIRKTALEAITWESAQADSVLEDVRLLAAEDPEPAVRQAAAMALAVHDDSSIETRTLLETLVADESVSDRDFFQQQLDRIDEEAAAEKWFAGGDVRIGKCN